MLIEAYNMDNDLDSERVLKMEKETSALEAKKKSFKRSHKAAAFLDELQNSSGPIDAYSTAKAKR